MIPINLKYFIDNNFIQTIAENNRWTVSTKNKMPIDMNILRNEGKIKGATYKNGNMPLVNLYDIYNILPNAVNATYNLNQNLDNFVVLDIEPKCPEQLKNELLKLPYIYGELSMSGKGFHLVFPKPVTEYEEILISKTAIREENGYYEFLLTHYVTFTGIILKQKCTPKNISEYYKIFDNIAKTKQLSMNKEIDTSNIPDIDNIIYGRKIVDTLKKAVFEKELSDFKNDYSAYEFGVIGFYMYNLELLLSTTKYLNQQYTDQEKGRILYTIVSDILPYRPKHDELRNGMPMLMYSCIRAITRINLDTIKPLQYRYATI